MLFLLLLLYMLEYFSDYASVIFVSLDLQYLFFSQSFLPLKSRGRMYLGVNSLHSNVAAKMMCFFQSYVIWILTVLFFGKAFKIRKGTVGSWNMVLICRLLWTLYKVIISPGEDPICLKAQEPKIQVLKIMYTEYCQLMSGMHSYLHTWDCWFQNH